MRGAVLLACLTAACGRIGFSDRTGQDAPGTGDGPADSPPPANAWSHLAAYQDSTCAVRNNQVYCWGDNGSGQVMVAIPGVATPTLIPLPTVGTMKALSVGDTAACAIVGDSLYCWGSLGTPAPQHVILPTSATAIACGHGFQCVVAGDALCWGTLNGAGQLGVGDTNPRAAPTAVVHGGPAYVAVEVGDDHGCALDAAGGTWCWGHNDYGCLGLPMATNTSTTPVVQDSGVTKLPQIAGWHTCAQAGPEVKCWGEGNNGELGDGNNTSSSSVVSVNGLTAPSFVATGGGPTDRDASCAIDNGEVKCWGNGMYGRLGQGTAANASTPVTVLGLPGPAAEVAIGDDHACAALVDGDMYCWGRGDYGQLGNGIFADSLTPVKVIIP